jgi:hypothetical protein
VNQDYAGIGNVGDPSGRVVCGTVVDDYDFEIDIALIQRGMQSQSQHRAAAASRDHYRDVRHDSLCRASALQLSCKEIASSPRGSAALLGSH